MSVRCGSCGHLEEDGALFCSACHHYLAWSGPSRSAPAPPAPAPPAPAPPAPAPSVSRATEPAAAPRPPSAVAVVDAAIAEARRLAEERRRPDLVQRLDAARDTLRHRVVTVAVVGEFKRGKSALVNALVQRPVCPEDADVVTAVPTLVRFGEQHSVTAYRVQEGEEGPRAEPVPPERLASVVAEEPTGRDGSVASVEVRVPHRILRTGLRLLDTPGVGGLESAAGQLTLGSLASADGALFVTDASQELTQPEMAFLRTARERCPRLAVVVTKKDLHLHWPEVVERDRAHLARAGIDVPVVAVSSDLRMRAARRPELNEESGFASVVEFLAVQVVRPSASEAADVAAHEVDLVADQLARQADAERVVLARPEQGAAVVERLDKAHGRAQALGAAGAGWHQLLNDGVQDLVADVEHDLQARLRRVLDDARDLVDRSDPRDTWADTGAWLRRQVAAAAVANQDLLVRRAEELTEAVAAEFHLASGETVDVQLDLVTRTLEELELPTAASFTTPGGRLASLIVTARTTALVPMVAISVGTAVPILLPWLAGSAVLATTGIGAKLFRDESRRHREHRRQQAKAAAARFVEAAAFDLNKATRDSLRRTQRLLRDEFQGRARMLQASAGGALEAAQRARSLDPAAQARRTGALAEEAARIGSVRATLRDAAVSGVAGGR